VKRTRPLVRRAPLKADPAKARAWADASRKELPAVNKERRKRRADAGLVYGPYHRWIKQQPCALAGHPRHRCGYYEDRPGVEGHHLKHVGNGGQDRDNELPLCPVGHDHAHALGSISALCEHYGRDFRTIAALYTEDYDHTHTGDATP